MRDDLVIKAFKNNHKEMMHQTIEQYSKLLFNISASILKGVGSQEDISGDGLNILNSKYEETTYEDR